MPDKVFAKRPIAITDVETTGLDASLHEIVEIGLLVVDQTTFKILDRYQTKVRPLHPERGAKTALTISGYNAREWRRAVDLEVAMQVYSDKTRDAIFLAHNVYFDWSFITRAFQKTGVEDFMDYHRLDLFSLAWAHRSRMPGLKRFNLETLCRYFALPVEPKPHRAMNGARTALAVLKKLSQLS